MAQLLSHRASLRAEECVPPNTSYVFQRVRRSVVSVSVTLALVSLHCSADEVQTRRLVDLAYLPRPMAMDAELIVRYPPPKGEGEESTIKSLSATFSRMLQDEGRAEQPGEREHFIARNLRIRQETAGNERICRKRVRYRGIAYREDRTCTFDGRLPPATQFEETVVNSGNPLAGDFTSFEYINGTGSRKAKHARIFNQKGGQYAVEPIWNLLGLHDGVSLVIAAATAEEGKRDLATPSAGKVASLEDGTNPNIRVEWADSVVPGTSLKAHKCSIFAKTTAAFQVRQPKPVVVVFLDPADYRRDWRVELRDPYSGSLATVTEKRDFGDDGVPRRYVRLEYPRVGEEKRRALEVLYARAIPVEQMDVGLFEFRPPAGYTRTAYREPGPAKLLDAAGNVLNQRQVDSLVAKETAARSGAAWSWRTWVLLANVFVVVLLVVSFGRRLLKGR